MKGFTLIELIIYIAVFAIILTFLVGFLWIIVLGNIKETSYQEIQQNGRFVLTKVNQEIKKAAGVNNPLGGNSGSSLSLAMSDPNTNPTVIDFVSGKLRITQGNNSPQYLTTDEIIISSLQFTNLSYENTPGTIRIEMSLDHINPGNRAEYQASVNFTSSVSLVPGGAIPPDLDIRRPQAHTDLLNRTTDPQLAYDVPDGITFAATTYRKNGDSIIFQNWQTPTQSYTSLVLKYRYHAEGATNDTYAVAFSTNGGTAWTDLISPTSASAPDTTLAVTFSPSQDLSQVRVKIYVNQVGGPDNKNIFTRDIWTEGSF